MPRSRIASCERDVALQGADYATTRFSPDLVDAPVRVLPFLDPHDRRPVQWIPVGHGRPYVPWEMPHHEVERAIRADPALSMMLCAIYAQDMLCLPYEVPAPCATLLDLEGVKSEPDVH